MSVHYTRQESESRDVLEDLPTFSDETHLRGTGAYSSYRRAVVQGSVNPVFTVADENLVDFQIVKLRDTPINGRMRNGASDQPYDPRDSLNMHPERSILRVRNPRESYPSTPVVTTVTIRDIKLVKYASVLALILFCPVGWIAYTHAKRAKTEFDMGFEQNCSKELRKSRNFTLIAMVLFVVVVAIVAVFATVGITGGQGS